MGIAAYHYVRIFNSWVGAYEYSTDATDPKLTGVPFNDAYRYMDWLLTVPLLLIEILLVMKLDDKTYSSKAWTLGAGSALMIVSGYYGELVITGDLTPRWACWALSMCFFLYIVYELLVGLSAATNSEANPEIKAKIQTAQVMTVISWFTYPVVYLFPMLDIKAATAVVSIQIVIAFLISSPSAALDWRSTRSHTRSPRRRLSSHSLMPCVLLLNMARNSCVFFYDFDAVSSTAETRVSSSYVHLDICSVR